MKIEIRYYSRSGNCKAIADAIGEVSNIKPISVDEANASINKEVDVLFIGGALYAYGLDDHLTKYLKTLDKQYIKKAVIFSSTWISKHSIELIRKNLEEKGIEVVEDAFYVRGKPSSEKLNEAKAFAKKYIEG